MGAIEYLVNNPEIKHGDVEETKANYIIRDHFKDSFEEKKKL